MNVTEAEAGDGDGLQRDGILACYFAPLAVLAVTALGSNICGHAFPQPAGSDQPPCCSDARVGQSMDGGENCWAVGLGDQWAEVNSCC